MAINPGFLAPCGLYCGVCGVYYATRDENEKFLQKLLNVYKSRIRDSRRNPSPWCSS